MRIRMLIGVMFALSLLTGCPSGGAGGRVGGPGPLFGGGPNCELKSPDGSGTCDDGSTLLGRAEEPQPVDDTAEPASAPASESLPSPQEEAPSGSSGTTTGGCVWQGRQYRPGDKIRSSVDGTIVSSELEINGQSFETLSGQSGPWQGCDCLTSSQHWGCV